MPVINYVQKASQFKDALEALASEKTYHYYNGESLSRVVDEQGNEYLCLWVDNAAEATYLYRPLSSETFEDIEALRVSLRNALLDSTTSRLAYVVRYVDEEVNVEALHVNDIDSLIPLHHFGITGEVVFVKDDSEQAA